MSGIADLIERMEKLEGPSREVDAEIDVALSGDLGAFIAKPTEDCMFTHKPGWWSDGANNSHKSDEYTASLDAATALVELVLPGAWYLIGKGKTRSAEPLYGAQIMFGSDEVIGEGEHDATLAIALCLATLRALQQEDRR